MKTIKWKNVEIEIGKIKPTPNNFKLNTDEGAKRFETSVNNFGLAGAVIVNTDYTLIDGNTRLEKAKKLGHKKIWVSMPDRKLTPKEFTEFSAMHDFAKAGEVDTDRIKKELGTTDEFFKKWGIEIPSAAKEKFKAVEQLDSAPTEVAKTPIIKTPEAQVTTRAISLLFTVEEAADYVKMATKLYSAYKVDNITDLSMSLLKERFAEHEKKK